MRSSPKYQLYSVKDMKFLEGNIIMLVFYMLVFAFFLGRLIVEKALNQKVIPSTESRLCRFLFLVLFVSINDQISACFLQIQNFNQPEVSLGDKIFCVISLVVIVLVICLGQKS